MTTFPVQQPIIEGKEALVVPMFIETSVRTSIPEPSVPPPAADSGAAGYEDSFASHLREPESLEKVQSTPSKEEQAAEQTEECAQTEEPATEPEVPVGKVSEAAEALAAEAALAIAVIATETPSVQGEAAALGPETAIVLEAAAEEKAVSLPTEPLTRQLAETTEAADAEETVSVETTVLATATKRDVSVRRAETVTGKERKPDSRMRVADEVAPKPNTATPEAAPEATQNSQEIVATAAIPEKNEEERPVSDSGRPVTAPADRRPARQGTDQVAVVAVEPITVADDGGLQEPAKEVHTDTQTAEVDKPTEALHSRFGQHLLQRGTERSESGPRLSDADEARLIDRVARAVRFAENRDGLVRLRLSPPELGSLRLELRVQGGVMTARLEAETNGARSLLMENLPVLRDRLAEQGIRIEQFEVDLRQRQGQGGESSGTWEQRGGREPSERSDPQAERRPQTPETTSRPGDSRPAAASNPRGLDVIV